jgi:hypothetical protein
MPKFKSIFVISPFWENHLILLALCDFSFVEMTNFTMISDLLALAIATISFCVAIAEQKMQWKARCKVLKNKFAKRSFLYLANAQK